MSTPTPAELLATWPRLPPPLLACPRAVALIPARGGSERVPGKNVRPLAGHPLIAYSIAAARGAGALRPSSCRRTRRTSRAWPSTTGPRSPTCARPRWRRRPHRTSSGCGTPSSTGARRPGVRRVLDPAPDKPVPGRRHDRRCASPAGGARGRADSIRAVERCRQHPGKMWMIDGRADAPPAAAAAEPPATALRQYKALPEVHVQNSSLEIAWTRAVTEQDSISGERVAPFITHEAEGFSIDYEDDWATAERLMADGAQLPSSTRRRWAPRRPRHPLSGRHEPCPLLGHRRDPADHRPGRDLRLEQAVHDVLGLADGPAARHARPHRRPDRGAPARDLGRTPPPQRVGEFLRAYESHLPERLGWRQGHVLPGVAGSSRTSPGARA